MERQEDGYVLLRSAQRISLIDQRSQRVWPGVRRAGLVKAEPGAGVGPRRA
jgi:hypothetical protein